MSAGPETTYVCEHCATTEQWSCPCWEAEAARYWPEAAEAIR